MWDEKQFFDDFIRESDQIQPSAEFVNRMKNLSEKSLKSDVKKQVKAPKVFTGVLAAAAVVGILVMAGLGQNKRELIMEEDQIFAEKEDETDAMEGNLSDVFDESKSLLENALTNKDTIVKDGNGKELTSEEKDILLEQMKQAEKTDLSVEDLEDKETVVFEVEGDAQIHFSIVENEYLIIQNLVYRIQ